MNELCLNDCPMRTFRESACYLICMICVRSRMPCMCLSVPGPELFPLIILNNNINSCLYLINKNSHEIDLSSTTIGSRSKIYNAKRCTSKKRCTCSKENLGMTQDTTGLDLRSKFKRITQCVRFSP